MAIIAKKPESIFTPCPEGLHHAVCVDVIDLGIVPTPWGDKHKVRIVWQIDDEDPDTGQRYDTRQQYNCSLHEKASLRNQLESWRGRKFTEKELMGFDLEKLIGANCQIQVVHTITDQGKTYANVQAVVPAPKNTVKLIPKEYVREKDRAKQQGNNGGELTVEDIPFAWALPFFLAAALLPVLA